MVSGIATNGINGLNNRAFTNTLFNRQDETKNNDFLQIIIKTFDTFP